MPKYIDSSDLILITDKVTNNIIDKGLIAGVFAGYVSHNSRAFPTKRLDGSPLKNYDYVKPAASSIYPFTIGSVTFVDRFNRAHYLSGSWILEPGEIPNTSEVSVKDPLNESFSGTATTQSEINKENKTKYCYIHDQRSASNSWVVHHNLGYIPSVIVLDSFGHQYIGEIVYNDLNTLTITFSVVFSGKAYLS